MVIVPTEKQLDWKRAPVILFLLVLCNALVYFLYQAGDEDIQLEAYNLYMEGEYAGAEWPLYQDYLRDSDQQQKLQQLPSESSLESYELVAGHMLFDLGFYEYLDQHYFDLAPPYIPPPLTDILTDESGREIELTAAQKFKVDDKLYQVTRQLQQWTQARRELQVLVGSTSSMSNGLVPGRLEYSTLLTHQFLHGDVMHLLGNMFFLVVCGFAVEAALGHGLFLLFYLLAGVAGGLLHIYFQPGSYTPLVGASGAISGVMAMYLGVFRFKKIEFFYWLFVFVGYFRAPALVILPLYIGKEVYNFYLADGSNVAFMAHAGGFVAGAACILLVLLIRPSSLDQEYIEEDQSVDENRTKLAKVYTALESFQFAPALKLLNAYLDDVNTNFQLSYLRFNLAIAARDKRWKGYLNDLLQTKQVSVKEAEKLTALWHQHSAMVQLSGPKLATLGLHLIRASDPKAAEQIFARLYNGNGSNQEKGSAPARPQNLDVLAGRLAQHFKKTNNPEKHQQYQAVAAQLSKGGIGGPL